MSTAFPFAFLNSMVSPMEMGMVLVAILVLFGAKSLPGTLRTLGRWMEQLRRLSDEFRGQLMDVDREIHEEFDDWSYDYDAETVSTGYERPEAEEDGEPKALAADVGEDAGVEEPSEGEAPDER